MTSDQDIWYAGSSRPYLGRVQRSKFTVTGMTSGQRIFTRDRITGGIFHWENLTWHSNASAASQLECWSTACGEIPTSGPLGTVLGGMWENPDVIPSKVPLPTGHLDAHIIHSFLGPPESTPKQCLDQFSHCCRAHGRSGQTERLTDRQTDHATPSAAIGAVMRPKMFLLYEVKYFIDTHYDETNVQLFVDFFVPKWSVWPLLRAAPLTGQQ